MTIKKIIIHRLKGVFKINDQPKRVAKGFGLGTLIGMLPIPGFQVLLALLLSSLLKVNKKAACVAVVNINLVTGAFIFAFNYWLGKQLLGFNCTFSMPDKISIDFFSILINAGVEVFLSLFLGGVLTGVVAGLFAYFTVRAVLLSRLEKLTQDEGASIKM